MKRRPLNLHDRAKRRDDPAFRPHFTRQLVIKRMTDWQRSQWARAGYPKNRIGEFAELRRPGHSKLRLKR